MTDPSRPTRFGALRQVRAARTETPAEPEQSSAAIPDAPEETAQTAAVPDVAAPGNSSVTDVPSGGAFASPPAVATSEVLDTERDVARGSGASVDANASPPATASSAQTNSRSAGRAPAPSRTERPRSASPVVDEPVTLRQRGKRSDPAFTQITAYVRKATYRTTQIRLLEGGREVDFSDIVEALLAGWNAGKFNV